MALDIPPPKRDLPRYGSRQADFRALWRLGGWGGAAALALAALAIAAQTDTGGERLQLAFATPAEPAGAAADLPPRLPEKETETRALEAKVRALAADRDRLVARLASLERHVDDMTGSIQRQAAPPAPAAVAAPTPAPTASAPASLPQIASVAPIAATAAAVPVPPVIDPLAMPAATATGASWPATAQPKPQAEAVLETVPLPPDRVAALTPAEHAAASTPALKYEYGIELANAPNMDTLRGRWAEVKANYGPLLTGLQPVAVHDRRPGGSHYRLIAGPLMNFAAAKQKCIRFTTAGAACRPARFDSNSIVQR